MLRQELVFWVVFLFHNWIRIWNYWSWQRKIAFLCFKGGKLWFKGYLRWVRVTGVVIYFCGTLTLAGLCIRSRTCHHLKWGGHLSYAFLCNRRPWVKLSSSDLQWHQHERWCLCCCLQLGEGDKPFPGKEFPWRFVMTYDLLPLEKGWSCGLCCIFLVLLIVLFEAVEKSPSSTCWRDLGKW